VVGRLHTDLVDISAALESAASEQRRVAHARHRSWVDSLLEGAFERRTCIFLTSALLTGAAAGTDALERTGSAYATELEATTPSRLAAAITALRTLINPSPLRKS
jgi:hypothetical protein